ncbi:hypothetical protein [Lacticaseibacillus hulanensis]|uniref:hypothetical protein n=1 Tax=Lacticaseibacillus hulanensis TaxID=2493111 RepID=UPI000FD84304|nr:hypothetical protein [Lacticaseibacillus hulanensis]
MKPIVNHQAFIAGNSSDGTTWIDSTPGVLSYEDYISIFWMLVDDMKEDLGRHLDKKEFEADMEDIVRSVTKKAKHPRAPINPESIAVPELRLKEIQSDTKKTLKIDLSEIRKVQMYDDYFVIMTDDGFTSFTPRVMFQALVNMTSKDEAIMAMNNRHIQYILFAYEKTTASVQKILEYSMDNNLLEDNRRTQEETVKQQEDFVKSLFSKTKHRKQDNVVHFPNSDTDK